MKQITIRQPDGPTIYSPNRSIQEVCVSTNARHAASDTRHGAGGRGGRRAVWGGGAVWEGGAVSPCPCVSPAATAAVGSGSFPAEASDLLDSAWCNLHPVCLGKKEVYSTWSAGTRFCSIMEIKDSVPLIPLHIKHIPQGLGVAAV